jgi:hypothetical protein
MDSHHIGELHRVGVKWYARESSPLDMLNLIPVFHRWISERVLPDLMIDVAEYTHVQNGPGVLIVATEGNYGYDETGGARGMVYYSKEQLPEGDLASRLASVARKGLQACVLFQREPGIGDKAGFPGDRVEVFSNDRLLGPNTDAGWGQFEPAVKALAERLFGAGNYRVERSSPDPRERLTGIIHAPQPATAETLLARLS